MRWQFARLAIGIGSGEEREKERKSLKDVCHNKKAHDFYYYILFFQTYMWNDNTLESSNQIVILFMYVYVYKILKGS